MGRKPIANPSSSTLRKRRQREREKLRDARATKTAKQRLRRHAKELKMAEQDPSKAVPELMASPAFQRYSAGLTALNNDPSTTPAHYDALKAKYDYEEHSERLAELKKERASSRQILSQLCGDNHKNVDTANKVAAATNSVAEATAHTAKMTAHIAEATTTLTGIAQEQFGKKNEFSEMEKKRTELLESAVKSQQKAKESTASRPSFVFPMALNFSQNDGLDDRNLGKLCCILC
jgi:hypothetical protein